MIMVNKLPPIKESLAMLEKLSDSSKETEKIIQLISKPGELIGLTNHGRIFVKSFNRDSQIFRKKWKEINPPNF